MQGIFITGTDTGVGKTHVTALLARYLRRCGIRVGIYKPVCSGIDSQTGTWSDLERLFAALEGEFPHEWICPQRFAAPLAPPVAAALEGAEVDARLLHSGRERWRGIVDVLLVEGVGGWLCPLTDTQCIADLAEAYGDPLLLVAADRLGMMNQTLLSLQSMKNSGLPIIGAVVNRVSSEDDGSSSGNLQLLRKWCDVPILGPLPWMGEQLAETPQIDEIFSAIQIESQRLTDMGLNRSQIPSGGASP